MNKKNLGMVAGAFAAFYVLKQPDAAAAAVNNAASGIGDAADSLAQFVNALAS
ncbi:hypothetical protein [Actinocorallia longicatena]|uniref:Uncharacterized protein n=1 Tax=Actinocorallia longicatena TaxID=111803 RepID=A0ABP6QC78_9ACTN